jgi:eukaryotic-like serine/threonine-protein kinase
MTHFRELTDRYTLEKILRSTRAGTVLRAIDNQTGRAVVIKLINVPSPQLLLQRAPELEKLGAALEALREPSLPAVTDSGLTTEGSAFLAMELLEGQTLDALAGPPQRLLGLLAQALDGLEALARRGIAHQNLAPDNFFVTGAPPSERIKILGLGSGLFRPPAGGDDAAVLSDARADLAAFARTACQVLGINVTSGEPPSAQMPFALSLELENAEALRRCLELCLRRDLAERPTHAQVRDAFRLALGATPQPVAPRPMSAPVPVLVPPPPAMPAPAAVPAPGPAPAEDLEMLSAIDDDILNTLSAAPPAPALRSAEPPAGRVVPFRGGGSAVAAAPPPKPNPVLRPGLLIAVAAILVLGAAGVFWWLSRGASPAQPAEAAAPAVPPPPPRRPAAEVLAEAQLAMADERWDTALQTLGTLNGFDQAALPPAGCRALAATEETLARLGADRLPEILAQGLKRGDLGRLRFAIWAAESQGTTLPAGLQTDLIRAHGLLDLYAAIEEAAARKADTDVLERFAALDKDFPGISDPQGLRERSATALETEAEELAREGKYEEALGRLDAVLRSWPKRAVARGRSDVYRRARQLTLDQEALLEVLPAALRRKKPHEGLEMLRGVEPVPHLAAQIEDLRKQLEEQLTFLDQQPPEVTLRDGYFLDYDRGQVVELSFRVKDDYLVRSVKLMARPEGGRMRELKLEKASLGYTAEIPPDFHRNGTVELYFVASDASGHEGFFGTPSQPKLMRRRQGFDRLVN